MSGVISAAFAPERGDNLAASGVMLIEQRSHLSVILSSVVPTASSAAFNAVADGDNDDSFAVIDRVAFIDPADFSKSVRPVVLTHVLASCFDWEARTSRPDGFIRLNVANGSSLPSICDLSNTTFDGAAS